MQEFDLIVIGGGAAGFFTAINAAEMNSGLKIAILERGKEVLTKVHISGGGRCNLTHAEFLPEELSKNYPRGEKELLGPFHKFMTGDTIAWFEDRGVSLKTEEDGRMFPVSDSSESIINCFLSLTKVLNIQILKSQSVKSLRKKENFWEIITGKDRFWTKKVMLATGSNPKIWKMLEELGHSIIPPVPSLFTFNIQDKRIENLAGISTGAEVEIIFKKEIKKKLESLGPLLITHLGMSGPAVLKLSAWGARELFVSNYSFKIKVNWLPELNTEDILYQLQELKNLNPKKQVLKYPQFNLPRRLWKKLCEAAGIKDQNWAQVNKKQLSELNFQLTEAVFQVNGKSTFKEEFVTAGGVDLKEIKFKTFESKLHKNLFLAGEVLNIDAITGGFNFQNAWTGGYLAAKAISV